MTEHIKITNVDPRIQYVGDGKNNIFEFNFAVFKASNLAVYINDKIEDSSLFQVHIKAEHDGGSVELKKIPQKGDIVTLCRSLNIERTSDFYDGATLRASVLNDELDYQTACLQEVAEHLNRGLVLPPYVSGIDKELVLPLPEAGKSIVWNEQGTNLENSHLCINALDNEFKNYKQQAEQSALTAKQCLEETKGKITEAQSILEQTKEQKNTASQAADRASNSAKKAEEEAAATQVNLSNLEGKINQKLDNNLANIPIETKKNILAWNSVNWRAGIGLTLNAKYVAPKQGVIRLGYIWLGGEDKGSVRLWEGETANTIYIGEIGIVHNAGGIVFSCFPVQEGKTYYIDTAWTVHDPHLEAIFYPLEGV